MAGAKYGKLLRGAARPNHGMQHEQRPARDSFCTVLQRTLPNSTLRARAAQLSVQTDSSELKAAGEMQPNISVLESFASESWSMCVSVELRYGTWAWRLKRERGQGGAGTSMWCEWKS